MTPAANPVLCRPLTWTIAILLTASACATLPAPHPSAPAPTSRNWSQTLENVVPCVVSLQVTSPRNFDTESAGSFEGTGFVVDQARGLILTNRHLVTTGPVVAQATFYNHEEVEVHEVYRDPVHDFGLYRFDPSMVRYAELCELELAPNAAQVGTEIRVVGNDAGEQISILSGTLARLDRDAPNYGLGTYNDFNTFYYQAASSTSGGSSGSPVINIDGQVVALNAGGSVGAATSYYLPLHRVVRALDLIQRKQSVTRGTLHTIFKHTPFDELKRLKLQPSTEATVRRTFPETKGLLVVHEVIPRGSADAKLEPGDILVSVNDRAIAEFEPLEDILDTHVGQTLRLSIERQGESLTLEVPVADLHATSPDEYIEVSQAIIHPLSYQRARGYNAPIQGLTLAATGYMFDRANIPYQAVLVAIDDTPLDSLDTLAKILGRTPDGQRLRVRYHQISDNRRERVAIVTMDRRWNRLQRCKRVAGTGDWPCEELVLADAKPRRSPPPDLSGLTPRGANLPGPAKKVARSLVMVGFDIPYRTEGVWGSEFLGTGVIVDAEQGLIVTDRDTVPVALGDVEIAFAGTVKIPGHVEFIHPLHNIALISYDPTALGGLPVEAVTLSDVPLKARDAVWQIALDGRNEVISLNTLVTRLDPLDLPVNRRRPEFRDTNLEVVELDNYNSSRGGVLTDAQGRVQALWASFHYNGPEGATGKMRGLPIHYLKLLLSRRNDDGHYAYRTLGVELKPVSLAAARDLGLPDTWLTKITGHDPTYRRVMVVDNVIAGMAAADVLKTGDLLLAINGQPVTRFFEIEAAAQAAHVALTVLRGGRVTAFEVPTTPLSGQGVTRLISWAGTLIHAPFLEIAAQYGVKGEGVYVNYYYFGTPANRYAIYPSHRIIEVNGVETPDLDAFIGAVEALGDRDVVRLKMRTLSDREVLRTLKLDLRYWPTEILKFTPEGWRRESLSNTSIRDEH